MRFHLQVTAFNDIITVMVWWWSALRKTIRILRIEPALTTRLLRSSRLAECLTLILTRTSCNGLRFTSLLFEMFSISPLALAISPHPTYLLLWEDWDSAYTTQPSVSDLTSIQLPEIKWDAVMRDSNLRRSVIVGDVITPVTAVPRDLTSVPLALLPTNDIFAALDHHLVTLLDDAPVRIFAQECP